MTDMTQAQVDALEAAKVVRPGNGLTTKQIMMGEMKVKRAAVLRVRWFFYGPKCAPTLRNQALQFVSFGTTIKYDWLMSDERYWNRPRNEGRTSPVGRKKSRRTRNTNR